MKLSARQKQELIKRAQKGEKVTSLCREYGISRYTFYKYLKRWQADPRLSSLKDQRTKKRGRKHWKGSSKVREKAVLEVVLGHPAWSSHKIASFLTKRGFKISNHGVQGILERKGLSRKVRRAKFQKKEEFFIPEVPFEKFTSEEKLRLILTVLEEKKKVTSACRQYGISRYTFYKWANRYQEAPERWQEMLLSKKPKGESHWHYVPAEKQKLVFDLVAAHPEYSCHRLASEIKEIGHHGIQNILYRNGLNTYQKRLAHSQTQAPVSLVSPVTAWVNRLRLVWEKFIPTLAPAPPPVRAKDFAKILLTSSAITSVFLLAFLFFLQMLSGQPASTKIGLAFASTSLTIGSFFFAYSMKYYFTLALVLSFSRYPPSTGSGQAGEGGIGIGLTGEFSKKSNGERRGLLARIFGLRPGGGPEGLGNGPLAGGGEEIRAPGLTPSLEHVKLERYPFVSIHLPFYNERRVANRILSACTAFDYPAYEVIVCDDSTDETVKIVKQWEKTFGPSSGRGHPKVKVIHRETREGFKGGALKYAVQHMDPRTEFVLVFDADFVPYPDTITQFLKYFKATGGWDEEKFCKAESIKTMPYDTFSKVEISSQEQEVLDRELSTIRQKSNIACVAGYQWHVLNKSENWITRGVRTEYAGSYVIERPGQEILGALKIIHGSVYCIRADILKHFGWGTSITEDFELTLRIYEKGFKVAYTPYIQAPSECVSTIKRLIRQRMRWSEGHSFNVRRMFVRLLFGSFRGKAWVPSKLTLTEKAEFLYLSPYYLQAFFFLLGTFSWLISETLFAARLPFWTSLWGWSLVLTNFFSLPLVNAVGLFLEESEEKDYLGILSFIALCYIMVPFQAYAAVKGFIEEREGPWFRTPKTGLITDIFARGRFYRWISGIIPGRRVAPAAMQTMVNGKWLMNNAGADLINRQPSIINHYLALATANNRFDSFRIRPKRLRWVSKALLAFVLILSLLAHSMAFHAQPAEATWYDTGWQYRKSIPLTGSGSVGTNYQVKIVVGYSSGGDVTCNSNCQTDFDDIRFTDDDKTTLLDHWRESYTGSSTATFWVEVKDSLSSGNNPDIYMYYGNGTVGSGSDGDATFEFFDDFDDGTVNSSKWKDVTFEQGDANLCSESGGTLYCSIGTANQNSASALYSIKDELEGNFDAHADWSSYSADNGNYSGAEFWCDLNASNRAYVRVDKNSAGNMYYAGDIKKNGAWDGYTYYGPISQTQGKLRITRTSDTIITLYRWDGSNYQQLKQVTSFPTGSMRCWVRSLSWSTFPDNVSVYWDNFTVEGNSALSDNFDDNSLDDSKWRVDKMGQGVYPSETSQKLYTNAGSTITSESHSLAENRISSVGDDFEAIVDFSNFTAPSGNTSYVRMYFWVNLQDNVFMALKRNSTNTVYNSVIKMNGSEVDNQTSAATSDTSGKLKIRRVGTTVTTFYWNGSSWTQLGNYASFTDDNAEIDIGVMSWDSYPDNVSANHDNTIVRKYASPEPSIGSPGSEEEVPELVLLLMPIALVAPVIIQYIRRKRYAKAGIVC